MTAPKWIESVVLDFGRAAGLSNLAINERGAAAVVFENGVKLRLEYAYDSLVVAVTVPAHLNSSVARRLLAYANPAMRRTFRLRAGWLQKSSSAVFAARLADREVTLPSLNAVFAELWRIAQDFGGVA
jgi:type III secretion system chaperone SycN